MNMQVIRHYAGWSSGFVSGSSTEKMQV